MTKDNSNAVAGKWPLAAKAGVDSHAFDKGLPPAASIRGLSITRNGYPAITTILPRAPLWNPVKVKMMEGGMVTSVTVAAMRAPANYCAAANPGVRIISGRKCSTAPATGIHSEMWGACPYAKAVPGIRIAQRRRMDEQHAGGLKARCDRGNADGPFSIAEAKEAVKWAYYPPVGGRSSGRHAPCVLAVCRAAIARHSTRIWSWC